MHGLNLLKKDKFSGLERAFQKKKTQKGSLETPQKRSRIARAKRNG